jgi:hypothetical protein
MNILLEADKIIHGDRQKSYGTPLKNHTRTAALWSAYLGVTITAEQVCYMNILQKVSRSATGVQQRDTLVDIAGFAGNIEMVEDERAAQQKLLDAAIPKAQPPSAIPQPIVIHGVKGIKDPLEVIRDLDSSGSLKWD